MKWRNIAILIFLLLVAYKLFDIDDYLKQRLRSVTATAEPISEIYPNRPDYKPGISHKGPNLNDLPAEEQAEMRAEFARWSEAYINSPMSRFSLIQVFELKYHFGERGHAYAELLREEVDKGDWFALASHRFRSGLDASGGSLDVLRKQAADRGEPHMMAFHGYMLHRSGDPEGFVYMEKALAAGEPSAALAAFYHKKGDWENMCRVVHTVYDVYGFEPFIDEAANTRYDYHQKCKLFGDREYTKGDMITKWLDDMGTEEAMFAKARFLSKREPVLARPIFEGLVNSEDNRISANSLGCLGGMYYRRYENEGRSMDDLRLAMDYAEKAFAKGNMCSLESITHKFSLPPVSYVTDYRGICGCF